VSIKSSTIDYQGTSFTEMDGENFSNFLGYRSTDAIEAKKVVEKYIKSKLPEFVSNLVSSIEKKTLNELLRRKNPYLMAAKGISKPQDLAEELLISNLQKSEQTIFGSWMEKLAQYLCANVHNNTPNANLTGQIDIQFQLPKVNDKNRYMILAIKSKKGWANSSQRKQIHLDFDNFCRAQDSDHMNTSEFFLIEGLTYSSILNKNSEYATPKNHNTYYRMAGQNFWHLLSGEENFYKNLITPILDMAISTSAYKEALDAKISLLTKEIVTSSLFDSTNGYLNWDKLVEFNAASRKKPSNI
jgi:hypothetical protein